MNPFDPPWEKPVYHDKEPQTGKKTVTAADLTVVIVRRA